MEDFECRVHQDSPLCRGWPISILVSIHQQIMVSKLEKNDFHVFWFLFLPPFFWHGRAYGQCLILLGYVPSFHPCMVFFCNTVFTTQFDVKWKSSMKMVKVAFHALLLLPLLELLMYINLGLFTIKFCFPLFVLITSPLNCTMCLGAYVQDWNIEPNKP